MSDDALSAFGTGLYHGSLVGETVTYDANPIAHVRDIEGPGSEMGTEDTTHHASPGAVNEFVPTTLNPGEVTFEINWLPDNATHAPDTGLLYWHGQRSKEYFMLEYPDGTTDEFAAYVTKFARKAPVKGVMRADVTLKISGLIVNTPATEVS
jgi:hypothetical protein